MPNSTARIPCPKCRSNNFLGTANCWQCGASLPPPEAIAQVQAVAAAPPSQPAWQQNPAAPMPHAATYSFGQVAPQKRGRAWMVVVPIVMLVLVGVGFLFMKAMGTQKRGPADDLKAQVDALKKQLGNGPAMSSGISSEDSLDIAAAKSQIDRLRKEHGIEPPADAAGNVHLQGGGTVSREEYRRALDAINRSTAGK